MCYATQLDKEQNAHDNPWFSFLKVLRNSSLERPAGINFMTWAADLYVRAKGDTNPSDGARFTPTVIRLKPVLQGSDELHNVYSASVDVGFYDEGDFESGLEMVDDNDPLSLLLAKEEAAAEIEPIKVDTTANYGEDIVQPKSREEAFPAAHGSRPPITNMAVCKVGPLDPMWRTFMALARHDEYKERMARRTAFNHGVQNHRVEARPTKPDWYKLPARVS